MLLSIKEYTNPKNQINEKLPTSVGRTTSSHDTDGIARKSDLPPGRQL